MIYGHAPTEAVDQISYPDYEYIRDHNRVFSGIAAAPNSISISEDRSLGNVKLFSRPVSTNYLTVLGIRPYLGRVFLPEDDNAKTEVAVMTYSCWKRLGSDPNIIGKTLASKTIVGVTPKEFTGSFYGLNGDVLTPLGHLDNNRQWRTQREARRLFLIGRLKSGVSRQQAQVEMSGLSGQLAAEYPKEDKDRTAMVTRATLLPPDGIATARLVAGILLTVVLLVLLIACANVANLLLAIAVGRRQEATIKLALGAARRRLILEFLKESVVICFAGAALGYAMAAVAIARYSEITVALPIVGSCSFALHLRMDATVAAFTLALTAIAIVSTGLAPALYASAPALSQVLSGEIVAGGRGKNVRRNVLVIVQVAVCTLVLVGMGLCQRSLYNLRRVDPGFSARNLLAVQVYRGEEAGASPAEAMRRFERLRDDVASLAGVEAVTLTTDLPLLGGNAEPVRVPGGTEKTSPVDRSIVDEAYFDTLRIRLLSGRVFTAMDGQTKPLVVVINRKMADNFWPGQDALGKTIDVGETPRKALVIGIVSDGKYEDLDEEPRPFLYYALRQNPQTGVNVVARTEGDPRLWIDPLMRLLRAPDVLAMTPVTFDRWLNLTLFTQRATAAVVAGLSALGLLLAVIGLFGAISYAVSERRKELGIRVALGAEPGHLLRMVLRQTALVAGAGIALGLLLGVVSTVLLRSQFYRIGAVEWIVLVPVSAAMLAVSLIVAYFSARPWIRIDPMEAVRHA